MDPQANDGDEPLDAETLYQRYHVFVARFLARRGIARSEIPDLRQEVFLVVVKAGGFKPRGARPSTWLAQIAWNLARDFLRKRGREILTEGVNFERLPEPASGPGAAAETSEGMELLRRAVDHLTPEQWDVFRLYEIDELEGPEIALVLDIPITTFNARLRAARAEVRRLMSEAAPGPGGLAEPRNGLTGGTP